MVTSSPRKKYDIYREPGQGSLLPTHQTRSSGAVFLDTHAHVNQTIEKWKAHLFSCRQLEKLPACSLSLCLCLWLLFLIILARGLFSLLQSQEHGTVIVYISLLINLKPPLRGAWRSSCCAAPATGLRPRTGGESGWAHLHLVFPTQKSAPLTNYYYH